MATMFRYQLPVAETGWTLQGETWTAFTWEYEDEREKLLALYDKGKKQQWDAAERIDWSQDLDPENPQEIDDRLIPIFGSDVWNRLTRDMARNWLLRFDAPLRALDALHLALAASEGLRVATLDADMARAAKLLGLRALGARGTT